MRLSHFLIAYEKSLRKFAWHNISKNPSITFDFIQEHIKWPWDWKVLSFRRDLDLNFLQLNLKRRWDSTVLSGNSKVSLEFIGKNLDWDWDWILLSQVEPEEEESSELDNILQLRLRPKASLEFIQSHPEWPWCWEVLSMNRSLSLDFIEANLDKEWDWDEISRHPNLTPSFILRNWDEPWNWNILSQHPNITTRIVEEDPELNWNWKELSANPKITSYFIENHHEKGWNWSLLSQRLDLDLIIRRPDFPWDWNELSKNPNMNIHFLRLNLDKEWDWKTLSANPGLHLEEMVKYSHLPWVWEGILNHPHLSWSFVKENMERWKDCDWKTLLQRLDPSEIERELVPLDDQEYWASLSSHPRLDFSFVEKSLDQPWRSLELNPNFDFEFFFRYPEVQFWNYSNLSSRVPISFVLQHPELPWEWKVLTSQIPISFIHQHPDLEWDWDEGVYKNSGLSLDFVGKHLEREWNWSRVFEKRTLFEIENFTHLYLEQIRPEIWTAIASSKNLNLKFVLKYKERLNHRQECSWSWFSVLSNPLTSLSSIEEILSSLPNTLDVSMGISNNPNLTLDFIRKFESRLFFNSILLNDFDNRRLKVVEFIQRRMRRRWIRNFWALTPKLSSDLALLIGQRFFWPQI